MKNERKNLKKNQLISFGITLIIIIVVNTQCISEGFIGLWTAHP